MDWPVIGAVAAVVIVGGAVAFEAVTLMRSGATPNAPPRLANYGTSVERTAYDIPGFSSSQGNKTSMNFPLIRLIDPDRMPDREHFQGGTKASSSVNSAGLNQMKSTTPIPESPKTKPSELKVARSTPSDMEPLPSATVAPARTEQRRVIPTATASSFNLGGHIDKAGIVDSVATPYLRDALKLHTKFGQLPPDIKTHILTQNINLPKIAPYRSLLGMDDRILEQEQGVKFVRAR
jgi:hypothetical protein